MANYDVYQQIAQRAGGELQIGVVGPVRTGKSTLIRRFMDLMVLPELEEAPARERVQDELPQSAAGRTIMTTQMQFVPSQSITVQMPGNTSCKLRLVDCVGYMVEGALGLMEGDAPRQVRTPWSDEEMPFEQAAELGTRKVIENHATLGLVVTTDGSVTDLPREVYVPAEERVVHELSELGKPFIVVLNSAHPLTPDTQSLAATLTERYGVPVLPIDILHMQTPQITGLLASVLNEFPARQMHIALPAWISSLPSGHWLRQELLELARRAAGSFKKLKDHEAVAEVFASSDHFSGLSVEAVHPENGAIEAEAEVPGELYYQVLSETCGVEIEDETALMAMMGDLVTAKREYDRLSGALEQVRATGYGVVSPTMEELTLEEPQLVRQGGQFGVCLKASAPSWHIMRVDIDTELSPTVGTQQQSEELVRYLMSGFESDPESIWTTEIFGKSLHDLVREGLNQKLVRMPEDTQAKLRETLTRILNDESGGMICILI